MGELEGGKYLSQVRVIYTDRARDFDRGNYWSLLPKLAAIASDPLHKCLEVESCPGGEMTRLSALLRKIHRKLAPSDMSNIARNSLARSSYFSQRSGGRQGSHVRTCEEDRLLQNENWTEKRCGMILMRLDSDAYVKRPFRKRSEYMELVLALIHSAEHSSQMNRRDKNATVETILRRAISLPKIEYLLNGMRYIAQMVSLGEVDRPPVGATTNEALAW